MGGNVIIKLAVLLIWLPVCLAQEGRPGGTISGVLAGDDGAPITGGSLMARRVSSSVGRVWRTDWYSISGDGGAFRFEGLPDGQYILCAQAPFSAWLNPCEWGLRPPMVTISRAQRSASLTFVLKKGAVVPIRVDDPGQLLRQHEGKTAGALLLLGVGSDSFVFHPALVASQESAGRNYRVVIPFDAPTKIVVSSPFYQLSDSGGLPLPRTGSIGIPVMVPAGQTPATLKLTITGGAK
jgi:hypothetical protein